jgi:hypothetical protein
VDGVPLQTRRGTEELCLGVTDSIRLFHLRAWFTGKRPCCTQQTAVHAASVVLQCTRTPHPAASVCNNVAPALDRVPHTSRTTTSAASMHRQVCVTCTQAADFHIDLRVRHVLFKLSTTRPGHDSLAAPALNLAPRAPMCAGIALCCCAPTPAPALLPLMNAALSACITSRHRRQRRL